MQKKARRKADAFKRGKRKGLNYEIKQLRIFCYSSEDTTIIKAFKKQYLLQNPITLIEDTFDHSELIDPKNKIFSTVRVGNIVTFMKVPGEEEGSYTIVGTLEVNPIEHKILIESPIGKSLLGNKIK